MQTPKYNSTSLEPVYIPQTLNTGTCIYQWVVAVAFSLLARILGESLTVHFLPALSFGCFLASGD